MKKTITLLLLSVVLLSCGEKGIEDNQDVNHNTDNGKVLYAGITETDEKGNFISIDMDDWRDDGILEGCYAYPNPATEGVAIIFTLRKSANIVIIIHNNDKEWIKDAEIHFPIMGKKPPMEYRSVWTLRTVKVLDNGEKQIKHVSNGIYRVFIYATDSDVIAKQLRDVGYTNAPKDKYSMVYGDVQVK